MRQYVEVIFISFFLRTERASDRPGKQPAGEEERKVKISHANSSFQG